MPSQTDNEYIEQFRYTDPDGRVWRVGQMTEGRKWYVALDLKNYCGAYINKEGKFSEYCHEKNESFTTPLEAFTALLRYIDSVTPDGELRVREHVCATGEWVVSIYPIKNARGPWLNRDGTVNTHGSDWKWDSPVAASRALDEYNAKQKANRHEAAKEKETSTMEDEFKVGDRVEVTKRYMSATAGMKGVIRKLDNHALHGHAIEMENPFSHGHYCSGVVTKAGHGYNIPSAHLRRIDDKPKWRVEKRTGAIRGFTVTDGNGNYLHWFQDDEPAIVKGEYSGNEFAANAICDYANLHGPHPPEQPTVPKLPDLGEWECEYRDDGLKVGCKVYTREQVQQWRDDADFLIRRSGDADVMMRMDDQSLLRAMEVRDFTAQALNCWPATADRKVA